VALVYLMEHPDAIQTAILQAANARVTPDLVEREARVFTPGWVAANDEASILSSAKNERRRRKLFSFQPSAFVLRTSLWLLEIR